MINELSNVYENPSATYKVYLIRKLVNTKMKEGGHVTNHVNKFNSIISRFIYVDIGFLNEDIEYTMNRHKDETKWSGCATLEC